MAFDVSGLNSTAYTDYMSSELSNASTNSVKKTLENTDEDSTDEELMSACKEFESYFLEQVFKEMEKSVYALKSDDEKSGSMGENNSLVSYFKDKAISDIASTSTETQGTGLAQMLYENMKRNYNL